MPTDRGRPSTRVISLGLTLAFAGLLGACAHPPRYMDESGSRVALDAFLSPYDQAWQGFSGAETAGGIARLEMVHPGIPTDKSVRLWYALRAGTEPDRPLSITAQRSDISGGSAAATDLRVTSGPLHPIYRTGVIDVAGLQPDSVYRLTLSGGGLSRQHELTLRTPPSSLSAATGEFSFLVSSCFLPWAVDDRRGGLLIRDETRLVMESLQARAEAPIAHRPVFHLRLGDQIYTDGGAGGRRQGPQRAAYLRGDFSTDIQSSQQNVPEAFDRLYRYNFGLPPIDASMTAIPTAMTIDDHEVRDGWGSYGDRQESAWSEFYGHGIQAFQAFQASRNPDGGARIEMPYQLRQPKEGFDFDFAWGPDARFFVLDTRSREGCGLLADGRRGAVCDAQLERFRQWLKGSEGRKEPTLLVVSLAVPLTLAESRSGRFAAGAKILPISDDSADRLPDLERRELLEMLATHLSDHPRHRLLILSGDVHYSGLTVLRLGKSDEIRGYEVISSGLAQQHFDRRSASTGSLIKQAIVAPFRVESRGVNAVPSFAEIFVSITADQMPSVKVLFYPGARVDYDIGVAELTLIPVDLQVRALQPTEFRERLARSPEHFPPLKKKRWFSRFSQSCLDDEILSSWRPGGAQHQRRASCTETASAAPAWQSR